MSRPSDSRAECVDRGHGAIVNASCFPTHGLLIARALGISEGLNPPEVAGVGNEAVARDGYFEPGARLRVARERAGERIEYGDSILLCEPRPGRVATFALDAGVIATSTLLSVSAAGRDTLILVTSDSRYELQLAAEPEAGAG